MSDRQETFSEQDLSNRFRNGALVCSLLVAAIHAMTAAEARNCVGSAAWWLYQSVGWGVGAAAVPFFFLASGYFLGRHVDGPAWWKGEMRKRVTSLLVPYVLWSVLFWIFVALVKPQGGFSGFSRAFGLSLSRHPQLVPLWYVRSLFLLVAVSPLLVRLLRKFGGAFLLFSFAASLAVNGLLGHSRGVAYFFYGTFSLSGLLYFSLGLSLRLGVLPWAERVLFGRNAWAGLLALAVGMGVSLAGKATLLDGQGAVAADCCWILSVPFLLVGLWQLIPSSRWPGGLTACAFPVFVLHLFFQRVALWHLAPTCVSAADWLARWAVSVGGALVLAVILRRCLPTGVTARLFGGR